MSLLNDVSIVVTPNGYKAGELYAVVPVPTEGSEEVNNEDFATDSYWTFGGTSFSAGAILFDNASDYAFQSWTNTVNTLYKLTITKTGLGKLRFRSGFAGSASTKIEIPESGIIYFTSTSDTNRIQIYGDSGSVNATLNSISVKEYTSADMDVTRATAATRVDENGLVNYAEVLGGEEVTDGNFPSGTTAWTFGTGWTISGGKATHTGATGNLSQDVGIGGKTIFLTFDILSIADGVCNVYDTSNATTYASFSTTGTKTLYFQSVSNSIAFRSNSTNVSIDNISVKEVTRDNVPRIDYTGGGCPHILAEPMRTNLIPYSEDFSNASWTKSGSSVTPNATTSPDGTINADKLVEDTSTGGHSTQSITSASNSTIYTTSVFVKYAGREWIRFTDAQSSNRIHFNTLTGVFGTISGTVIDYNKTALENGWYKLSFTTTSVATAYTPRIALAEADNDVIYTGDGVSGVYIWGAQLEEGSYPTSYIPTSGSTVTRNADLYTKTGISDKINSEEGVLFVEMAALSDDLTYRILSLSDGTEEERIYIQYTNVSNTIAVVVKEGGYTQANMSYVLSDETAFSKIAIKWKVNDFALWIDGFERATDTSGSVPLGLNRLAFDNASTTNFYGKVKQLQVYKTALTDDTLALLTT